MDLVALALPLRTFTPLPSDFMMLVLPPLVQTETTNELDPLKGLTLGCLLESRVKGGKRIT